MPKADFQFPGSKDSQGFTHELDTPSMIASLIKATLVDVI